jgi:hypothetical protein
MAALLQRGTVRPGERDVECHRQPQHRTLLSHGDVAAQRQGAGGGGLCSGSFLRSAELYDPASGTWSATAASSTHATSHRRRCCPRQCAGGRGKWRWRQRGTVRPSQRDVEYHQQPHHARIFTRRRCCSNGKVLVAGGQFGSSYLSSAELYDRPAGRGVPLAASPPHADPHGDVAANGNGARDGDMVPAVSL